MVKLRSAPTMCPAEEFDGIIVIITKIINIMGMLHRDLARSITVLCKVE